MEAHTDGAQYFVCEANLEERIIDSVWLVVREADIHP
jgi:hypothetical protein